MAANAIRIMYPMLPSSYDGIQALITVDIVSQKTPPTSPSSEKPSTRISTAMIRITMTVAARRRRMRPRLPFAMRLSNQYRKRCLNVGFSFPFLFLFLLFMTDSFYLIESAKRAL